VYIWLERCGHQQDQEELHGVPGAQEQPAERSRGGASGSAEDHVRQYRCGVAERRAAVRWDIQ